MDLELKCELGRGFDKVRFAPRSLVKGIIVDVTRDDEAENILLGDKDVERLYDYLGEYLGKDKEIVPEVSIKSTEEVSELLNMSFRCTSDPMDTFATSFDGCDGELYINVMNDDESSAIYLSSEDALTMAKNIIKAFENVGIEAEPAVEKPSLSVEEASSELQHNFYCATDDGSHIATGYDKYDNQLTLELTEDYHTTYICLKAGDAMTLSESITKVFGTEHTKSEPNYMRPLKAVAVVGEYEAASKEALDKVVADLKELKEDFHSSMESVVKDWSKLNKDINQVHVEISQIQNDIFNTNESTKVKLESLGKHIEGVSKEVVAAMEHLAGKVDYNFNEIHLIKSENIIRKINEDPSNVKV